MAPKKQWQKSVATKQWLKSERAKNPKSSNRRQSNEFANETTRFRMRFGGCRRCRCHCCFFGIAYFNQLWFMQCCLWDCYIWYVSLCSCVFMRVSRVSSFQPNISQYSRDILTRSSPWNMHTHVFMLCVGISFLSICAFSTCGWLGRGERVKWKFTVNRRVNIHRLIKEKRRSPSNHN